MLCSICQVDKLSLECLSWPLTKECTHMLSFCLRCALKQSMTRPNCTACEAHIQESDIEKVKSSVANLYRYDDDRKPCSQPASSSSSSYVLHVTSLDGSACEVELQAHASVLDLKQALQAKWGVPPQQQRILLSRGKTTDELKAYTDGRLTRLAETLVQSGDNLHFIRLFSTFAGVTAIPGAQRDVFGNALGPLYDLGIDGAFRGMTVAVLHLYGFDFQYAEAALKEKGFGVQRWTTVPPVDEMERVLVRSCQLWVISTNQRLLSDAHVNAIGRFFRSGRGLYIWGDNDPYYEDANIIAQATIGSKMAGNVLGCCCVRERHGNTGPGFERHLITTGLETLYEGETIATVETSATVRPLVYGSAGNVVTAVYEQGRHRAVIDGGFTRLFCKWDTAGTGRFVKNAAAWLVNFENQY